MVDRSRSDGTATMVFSDLAGSTALGERLDPETLRRVLNGYFAEMRSVFVSHGGTIEKIIGDAIVAVFEPVPSEEDAARRAVRAVADTLAALDVLNDVIEDRWGVRLVNRTGIATGAIHVERLEAGHSVLSGEVVTRAESMERSSPHLESLMDEATRDLVAGVAALEEMGQVPLKGTDGVTVPAFRLVSVDSSTSDGATRRAAASCAECGSTLPDQGTRCESCGAYVEMSADTRRTVTVVFADPKLTAAEGHDPDDASFTTALSRFFDAVRPVLESHGATVETFIGDAVMAVFGLPVRREDDALRAVRAAHDIRASLRALDAELIADLGVTIGCPIGVNTGEVVAGDAALGQRLVTGDVVNVAARLEQSAADGEILMGDLTNRLVRGRVTTSQVAPLTLKGKSEPVPAHRLEHIGSEDPVVRRRLPMVGRADELAALTAAFEESVATRTARIAVVVGDAGAGKSTLIGAFLDGAGRAGAASVSGRCLSYGEGITFWPLIEIVRTIAGVGDDHDAAAAADRIASALGGDTDVVARLGSIMGISGESFPVSEIFWAAARMLEARAADGPLVVVVEDIHWAEPTLLDLLVHLESTVRAPVTIVCGTRRALTERNPDWLEARSTAVVLDPLSDAEVAEMIDNALGDAGLGEAARLRVAEAAEGNPLFVEQLLSMLMDDGTLQEVDGTWVAVGDLDDLSIPPSIHALLASRIDGLPGEARRVVEPASVVGKAFAEDAVRHLVPDRGVSERLAEHLGELMERQIVVLGQASEDVGATYRFHHALLRDAAYQGLLKETRAVFHEEFVKWADVVNAAAGRTQEFEEILGFHLEQAYRYWVELGPVDDHIRSLGVDASRRLGAAGGRAFDRGDMPAAATLLSRAAALLDDEAPELPMLLLRSGEAKLETGDLEGAVAAVGTAVEVAAQQGDAGAAAAASVERLRFGYLTGSAGTSGEVREQAEALRAELSSLGHEAGLARVWRLFTTLDVVAARFGPAEQAAIEMVGHARNAGDPVMAIRIMQNLAVLAPVGPTPVPRAIERCETILERVAGDRRAAANTKRALAALHAMSGDIERSRALYRAARDTLEELGWAHDAALVSLDSGPAELLAGSAELAEEELRRDVDALTAMGDTFFLPTTRVFLAEALVRLGRLEEAEGHARACAETADPDDLAPQVLWRSVQAQIEAARGVCDRARELAAEAVERSGGSDGPMLRAEALRASALVERACGGSGAEAAGEAAALYAQKQATAGARSLADLLES